MNRRKLYYFDHNATTRVAPEVVEAMLPWLTEKWGNPSSAYSFGNQVAKEIERARAAVAELIHADPREITFTGCGTESINTAIQSALATQPGKRHVVTTAVEHSATLRFCTHLQSAGCDVTFLPVESDGSLDLHLLEKSLRGDTALVSVMWANNETGVIFPLEEIAALCRSKGVLCHTDGVQFAGKLAMDVQGLGVDMLSLSAHKFHAPKGVGALYVRRRTKFQPYLIGGQQEHGRRAGTENVSHIVGMGRAAELALTDLPAQTTRVRALRDHLEAAILKHIPQTTRNGAREPRLPNTTNIAFDSVEAEALLLALDEAGICASSGSACTTGSLEPSHVLTAMGVKPDRARGAIRFSLGLDTTADDVEYLLKQLPPIISRLRAASPASDRSERSRAPKASGKTRVAKGKDSEESPSTVTA